MVIIKKCLILAGVRFALCMKIGSHVISEKMRDENLWAFNKSLLRDNNYVIVLLHLTSS